MARRSRPSARSRSLPSFTAVALVLCTWGCGAEGAYVWYSQLPRTEWGAPPSRYLIGVGDAVDISVYGEAGLHAAGKVRRDGRIAVPLVGEVEVVGKRPADLARELEVSLKPFVVSPRVTVNVEQTQAIQVSTLGEIARVGAFNLEPPAGLVEALSQAGGLTDYADKSRIFVMRQFPKPQRIRFTYEAIIHNENGAATFPLRTGDVVIAE